jgi:hypothetical protein
MRPADIGAGLHRKIAAGFRFDHLIAVETRQIHERLGTPFGQPVSVGSVLDEQAGTEADRYREV